MRAEVSCWCGKLKSVKVQADDLYIFIGSEFTQSHTQLRLPGEATTRRVDHRIDGDEIHLISRDGAMMGGGVLSPDERRVSSPEWVNFNTPLGVLAIPGLDATVKADKNAVLDASFSQQAQ